LVPRSLGAAYATLVIRAREKHSTLDVRHGRGRIPDQLTLVERDQPLQAGSRFAQARQTAVEHRLAVMHAGRAPGKPARNRAETLPGARFLPSGRKGAPKMN
jgi:hypothetical protein